MIEAIKLFSTIELDENTKIKLEDKFKENIVQIIDDQFLINRLVITGLIIFILKEEKIKRNLLEFFTTNLNLEFNSLDELLEVKYITLLLFREVLLRQKLEYDLILILINRLEDISEEDKDLITYKQVVNFLYELKDKIDSKFYTININSTSLSDFERIILVAINLLEYKKNIKKIDDLMWLKATLDKLGTDPEEYITVESFYRYLINNLEILNLLYRYISKDKLNKLESFEAPLVIGLSIIKFSALDDKEQQLAYINKFLIKKSFFSIKKNLTYIDLTIRLILDLSLVWKVVDEKKIIKFDRDSARKGFEENTLKEKSNNYSSLVLEDEKRQNGKRLLTALKKNDLEIVNKLLNRRIDVNYSDNRHRTSLMYAIKFEREEIVKKILNLGADINVCDNKGKTPLVEAIAANNKNIVKILLKANCDTDIRYRSYTPLELAMIWNRKEIIPLLKKGS
ncbi:ankyrin repeat domain-containing protein [Orenia marismortui]|uniref:ankyrin repeat domain-containing protein n=1 Tax=Orenia marismortui TaxID=46469 RepID=UPI0003734605|nr:ankyrin repeat domain-containing protein [Orenia marismortui]